jgi:hypothetical protein
MLGGTGLSPVTLIQADQALQFRTAELRRIFARKLPARQKIPLCAPPTGRTEGTVLVQIGGSLCGYQRHLRNVGRPAGTQVSSTYGRPACIFMRRGHARKCALMPR